MTIALRPALKQWATIPKLNKSKYFFDRFGPAHGAFSLRLLNPRYTGDCVTLENPGGSRQTIGFSGDAVDESAITTFAAGGETKVYRWHNQFGDGTQLERGSYSNQPLMTNGSGTIYRDSQGRVALRFIGGSGARDIMSWDLVPAQTVDNWSIYILSDLTDVHPTSGGPPRFYIGGTGGHPENTTTTDISFLNTDNAGNNLRTQYNSNLYGVVGLSIPESNKVFSHRYYKAKQLLQNAVDDSIAESTVNINAITFSRTRLSGAFGNNDAVSCFCSDLIHFHRYVSNPQHLEIMKFLKQ